VGCDSRAMRAEGNDMPVDPEEMKREIAEISCRIEAGEEEMEALRKRTRELEAGGFPTHTALMYLGQLQQLQDTRFALRRQLQAHIPQTDEDF
jgi:protein-disulfide isomerase-like protein with CxxC motif